MQVQMTEKEIKTVIKTITIELTEEQATELLALLGNCRSDQKASLFARLWETGLHNNQNYENYAKKFDDLVNCPRLTNI